MDKFTGLTEDSPLRDRANALAMAICTNVEPPHTWLEAYQELESLEEGQVATKFEVIDHMEPLTWDELFNRVDCEADAINLQLQAAFVMGTKFGAGQ